MAVRGIGELVPGADGQAVVAAVDAVAEEGAEIFLNLALMLDGQVGNAATRVQLVGAGEGIGRAGILTGAAGAAQVAARGIGREVHGRVDRAEKQPRAVVAADHVRMLALPADPGRFTERLFHHRSRIDENLELAFGRTFDEPARQGLERLLHDIVIIAPLGIDRDTRLFRLRFQRKRIDVGRIAHAERDHASRFGP